MGQELKQNFDEDNLPENFEEEKPLGIYPPKTPDGLWEAHFRMLLNWVTLENGQKKITKIRFYGENDRLIHTIENEDTVSFSQLLKKFLTADIGTQTASNAEP